MRRAALRPVSWPTTPPDSAWPRCGALTCRAQRRRRGSSPSALGSSRAQDPRLREGNRGDWEGRLFREIARDQPDGYAAWLRAGADFRFPGGESLQEHSDRVWEALTDIRDRGPLPAFVVCHRGSIRMVLCRRDPRGLDAFHEYDVPNTGVVEL